ncbi:uncharacterized protein LOC124296619 [Neodiprion lecontei]|uniref:Uncharacterized protein LOC124296619 n=1 Tax=Neodiprion lecontei TaxID=441921 RepID=A0ABM3GQS4_NEOLC|nr:uncharacterized protein LOC124296619 [Neodiprion lecontei]
MIQKVVWCLFFLSVLSVNHCSPSSSDARSLTTEGKAESDEPSVHPDLEPSASESISEDVALEDSEDDPPGPPDHVIPYSEHEDPAEVPTRPKYVAPGAWAKPDPKKNIPLDFVPTKSLAQVRGTHTVKVLPQSAAIEEAETAEERENAPRLRQVVSNKKTNTIYTEEGYEDSAYDHAGHVRDADFHEGYAKKLHDQRHSKARSGADGKRKPKKGNLRSEALEPKLQEFEEFNDDYSDEPPPKENSKAKKSSRKKKKKKKNKFPEDELSRPDVNPKIVAENEIERLEDDLGRENEEAEKGSEKDLLRGEIENNQNLNSNAQISEYGADENNDSSNSRPQESVYNLQGDITTVTYESLNSPQPIITEAPTTANYGDVFWKYYSTSATPYNADPSTTLTAFNSHGPYLLYSDNAGVVLPIQDTVPIQNGHQPVNPNAIPKQEYGIVNDQIANPRSGEDYLSFVNFGDPATWGYSAMNVPVKSVVQTTPSHYDDISLYSTPTYSLITNSRKPYDYGKYSLPTDSSAWEKMYLESAKKAAERHQNYDPASSTASHSSSATKHHNQAIGREDLTGNNPLASASDNGKGTSVRVYSPDSKYAKMLNFVTSQQNRKYNGKKSESANVEDFTIMKPPAVSTSVYSDFTLNLYPNVAGYSTITQESEAAKEGNGKKFNANKNSVKHNGLVQVIGLESPAFHGGAPPGVDRKRLFPASKLLPPPPNGRDNYAEQIGYYKPANHADPLYVPRNRRSSRHPRSVDETALSEEKIADFVIAHEISKRFNFTVENDKGSTEHRDIEGARKATMRRKRNLVRENSQTVTEDSLTLAEELFLSESKERDGFLRNDRSRNGSDHEDLLNASHKIASDVIDEEIEARFEDEDDDAVKEGEVREEEPEYEDEDENEDEKARREELVEIDDPDLDYLDEIQDVNEIVNYPTTTVASIDHQKYPFYKNSKVSSLSPLQYIINPEQIPRKTFGGMEFYDSRDRYVECEGVDPSLDEVLPEEEEPVPNRGPKENLPRLRGLGDKLDCYKAKYFGQNPFDSPLFFEKQITQPTRPTELDPVKFAARIAELPELDEKHPAQSRKPETITIKRMDSGRRRVKNRNQAKAISVKSSVQPRTRKRNNTNNAKLIESLNKKPQRDPRRNRNRRPAQILEPTAMQTAETKSVTPYETEVYEDVMGTIKNMASLYEFLGTPTVPTSMEATIVSPNAGHTPGATSPKKVKTSNRVPIPNGKREQGFYPMGVTASPSDESIVGLLPPPQLVNKPKLRPYRTNKVSYNTRVRTERPVRDDDQKIIGYFRTVTVHKRSLDNRRGSPGDPEMNASKHIVKVRGKRNGNPSAVFATTASPRLKRKRKTNLDASAATMTTTTEEPVTRKNRPAYVVRTRSRNSKDETSTERHGEFTTAQRNSAVIDGRRKEPRYTEIVRKRTQTVASTTSTPSSEQLPESKSTEALTNPDMIGTLSEQVAKPGEIHESVDTMPRKRKTRVGNAESSDEIYEAGTTDLEPERIEENDESPENYEEENATVEPEKIVRKYDVHEDVQEETTPSVMDFAKPTRTFGHGNFDSFFKTDGSGFGDGFNVKPKSGRSESEVMNTRNEKSNEEQVDGEDEDHDVDPKNDSYEEEESSDEESPKYSSDTKQYSDSSDESADNSESEEKNSPQKDSEMTFFRYNSRPSSPFESFEDEKFSDLGPRINKPAFYHPSFQDIKDERFFFDDSDEDEKDQADESSENGKFTFGRYHDEEDDEEDAAEEDYSAHSSEKYEYPWEKRERLAEERRKERDMLRKMIGYSSIHDDDEFDEEERKASSSKKNEKFTYPWERYEVPSKNYKKNLRRNKGHDNEEVGSENRPVAKFSSKYSSNQFKLPFSNSAPITTAEPKKIRESVLKFLKEADKASSVEPTVAFETDISTTGKPAPTVNTPVSTTEKMVSSEPVHSDLKNTKRVSDSKIIPENITTAPRLVIRYKATPVRDRPTLRPSLKSATEAPAMSKTQTTSTSTTTTTTTRRPSRLKGRANTARRTPFYRSQEHQITTSTVLPRARWTSTTTTTTEKPGKLLPRTPGRFVVRKRVNSKDAPNLSQSQEVPQKSTTSTTVLSRRRKRPTVDTRTPTRSNTVEKISHTTKRPTSTVVEDRDTEDPKPTSRTFEHRSRVSKEEIITKTSFPNRDATFGTLTNKNTDKANNFENDNLKSKKAHSSVPGRTKNLSDSTNSEDDSPGKNESVETFSETMEETPEHFYRMKVTLDKDGKKRTSISIIPKDPTVGPSALEDELHLKRAKMEELKRKKNQGYKKFDEVKTQNAESDADIDSSLRDDSFVMGQLLLKMPPQLGEIKETDNRRKEFTNTEETPGTVYEDSSTEKERMKQNREDDKDEEDVKPLTVNYIRDPSQRHYYYIEDKK